MPCPRTVSPTCVPSGSRTFSSPLIAPLDMLVLIAMSTSRRHLILFFAMIAHNVEVVISRDSKLSALFYLSFVLFELPVMLDALCQRSRPCWRAMCGASS